MMMLTVFLPGFAKNILTFMEDSTKTEIETKDKAACKNPRTKWRQHFSRIDPEHHVKQLCIQTYARDRRRGSSYIQININTHATSGHSR